MQRALTRRLSNQYLEIWAGKMAQQGKVLATECEDLNSVSRTHWVEGKNQLLQVVLCSPLRSTTPQELTQTDMIQMER